MQRNTLVRALPAALLTLAVGFTAPCAPARAQGPFGAMMRGASKIVNPATSSFGVLLSRDDVKTELALSQVQNEQLTAEQTKGMQQMREKITSNLPDFKAMADLSDDERKSKMEEFQSKIKEVAEAGQVTMAQDMEKKAETILKPEQLKRLKELDLQWRGPLALGDAKVAEKFALTKEQKPKVAAMLTDYQKQQTETISAAFSGFKPGAGGPPDRTEMQAKMTKAQADIEILRKAQGEKVLPLLTEEQKTAWTAAQGKPFKFRKTE